MSNVLETVLVGTEKNFWPQNQPVLVLKGTGCRPTVLVQILILYAEIMDSSI